MPEFLNNAQYNFQTTGCTIKRDITMIKKKDLLEYRAWRQAYWITGPGLADKKIFHKVTPSSATLKQEWTVLRGVFSFGVEMGLVSPMGY